MLGYDRFGAVYARFHKPLWRYLVKLGGQDVAEDLTQEAFIRWWNSGAAGWEDGRVKAWLFTAATRLLIDWRRRHRRDVAFDEAMSEPERPAAALGLLGGRAWAALSSREQQLLWLAYVEEFSHAEIAMICGLAPGSIKVLLHRARSRIAELLKDLEAPDGR